VRRSTGRTPRARPISGAPAWDNGPPIKRLLLLRREAAQILGYPNFAALSLVPKMAKSVDEVLAFLRDLARRARPYAKRDDAALRAFAAAELGLPDLAPWDRAYASEKLKAQNSRSPNSSCAATFRRARCWKACFA
jgi:oligopeptidase A